MTISSAPITCSVTSNSTVGITAQDISSLGNITIGGVDGTSYYYTGSGLTSAAGSTITISNGGSSGSGYTIGGAGTGYKWQMPEEFVTCMPDLTRIEKMCEEYPGLKIAFERFKTTYKLVKDHYDTPEDQRPRP